ncbi:MAG TPA: metallophosphoesterase [Gaiellaceae bacterium]|nr:metallophosphoesterase [Gaiellaceae bacterium]
MAGAAAAAAGYAWFEAGWVRLETVDVPLRRLPPELDGLRIAHLSDFHLGLPSRGARAVRRAVEWAEERQPDLTLISGDLISRRSGEPLLRELLPRLPAAYAVLGNHDRAITKDPFAQHVDLVDLSPARLLVDEAETVELRGRKVQVVGVDPRSYRAGRARPERFADPDADLRILVCHFPQVIDRLEPGVFDLVLAGHLHAGQICVPYPGGKLRLAHVRWTYVEGVYERPGGVLHLSAGLGTTFVPFRLFARPAAYELRLHSGG